MAGLGLYQMDTFTHLAFGVKMDELFAHFVWTVVSHLITKLHGMELKTNVRSSLYFYHQNNITFNIWYLKLTVHGVF